MPTRLGLAPGAGLTIASLADLDRYLGAVAGAGFEVVSLSQEQLAGDPAAAARLVARHGLRCSDLLSLRVTRDDAATMAAAASFRPAVDSLGAGHVLTLMWTRVSPESEDRLGRVADLLGVPVALEFASGPVPTMAAASSLAGGVGGGRVAILADTYHFFRSGSTFEMLEAVPLEQLAVVQFEDALPAESENYLEETTTRRTWPGAGEFDLDRFASILARRGWEGTVSVEVLSAELRDLPVEEFARRAHDTTAPFWS